MFFIQIPLYSSTASLLLHHFGVSTHGKKIDSSVVQTGIHIKSSNSLFSKVFNMMFYNVTKGGTGGFTILGMSVTPVHFWTSFGCSALSTLALLLLSFLFRARKLKDVPNTRGFTF